ncbi:MAG: endo-1,4-beta-xylanase, partial [Lentisphaerae bacterium]|nr:endo-1,4-beta-xylanase [Lentisphaerota bacterium]
MTGRAAAAVMAAVGIAAGGAEARERWTEQEAAAWYARMPWLVGCNYNPASAINELEMWQAETFDPASIDRELGWAESLGFTSLRVYLHNIPWQQDAKGFLDRMDRFLAIADRHRIGVMFVLLDSCWDPHPKPGPQRAPRPHVHNSGWVQCPGAEILSDPARHGELRGYIHGVVARFKDDRRVHAWDVFNEPENDNRNSYGAAGG